MPRRRPTGLTTSATKVVSLRRRCEGHFEGADRSDKEAENDRESKDKFVSKGESLQFVPGPLEVDRDAEDDEEDAVEEGLENETEETCRRYGDHLQKGGGWKDG